MPPKVSVIIPNYNHAKYLDERIQSVLAQAFQDFELIILDDCSPDDGASKAIIEKYRNNPHVSHIVYNEENSGSPFKQWHKGMELARGEYIWIAESDDSCDNKLLEILVNAIMKNEAVMAFCRSVKYDANGRMSHYVYQDNLHESFVMNGETFIKEYLFVKNSVANASSVVFQKDTAVELGQPYTHFKEVGDWLFWMMLAERGKVCFIDEELNYFRDHSSNVTKKNEITGVDGRERIEIYRYFVKAGFLQGWKKHKYRARYTGHYLLSPLDAKTKKELMCVWDYYYVYRIMFWCHRLLCMTKNAFHRK